MIRTLPNLFFKYIIFILVVNSFLNSAFGLNVPIKAFPLDNYPQEVDQWLPPNDSNYQTPLVSLAYQKERLKDLYRHLYATDAESLSPWSKSFISSVLNLSPGILETQTNILKKFDQKNQPKLGYGENYHPYPQEWIHKISDNIELSVFKLPIAYNTKNRGIAVRNTEARLLPTHDPHFYSIALPGEGYPFDNLQNSALWVGTPVYKITETKDKVWALVVTPSFISWVKNDAIALVSDSFIHRWQALAKTQLMAITQTEAPVFNKHKVYQFNAYIGSIFPLIYADKTYTKIAIPQKTIAGVAQIGEALIKNESVAKMPIVATPENFARILKELQNRPYGWGNMYFYNDCSAELHSLYTPFGFWLPRNSQSQSMAGKSIDLTNKSSKDRLNYLIEKGHPLLTAVYVEGHVFLYTGNYKDARNSNNTLTAMTYQNLWALKPADRSRRAVIGQSVFLPLLPVYPEDSTLASQSKSKVFKIFYLDEWPDTPSDYTKLF